MDATELFVPEINAIIEFSQSKGSFISNDSYLRLKEVYEIFSCIKPGEDDEKRHIWIEVLRGPISAFGDYEEVERLRPSKNLNSFGQIITRKKATGIGLILQNIRTNYFSI
ncbi:MAG: hypothetical protein JNK09_01150 [Prolixibacteraceae bacterium]|nr:hypothetical protein [Prolixibacteraceae bacterium]